MMGEKEVRVVPCICCTPMQIAKCCRLNSCRVGGAAIHAGLRITYRAYPPMQKTPPKMHSSATYGRHKICKLNNWTKTIRTTRTINFVL